MFHVLRPGAFPRPRDRSPFSDWEVEMVPTGLFSTIGILATLDILALHLVTGMPFDRTVKAMQATAAPATAIAALADGTYQLCSAPDPQDWQNGAGVCFVFHKVGDRVEGYYGYPHSDQFICLRGRVEDNLVTGEAFTLSWAGNVWETIPNIPFTWDEEGHLTLSQGSILASSEDPEDQIDWILFRNALLEVDAFYPYTPPRMVDPAQLCNWNDIQASPFSQVLARDGEAPAEALSLL